MNKKIILLSIKPKYIDKIMAGTKLYEYRKFLPFNISHIVVYATAPIKKIVALIEVDIVMKSTIDDTWQKTHNFSGLTKKEFYNYFKKNDIAYYIKLGKIYNVQCKDLKDLNINFAPQSYVYINYTFEELKEILNI